MLVAPYFTPEGGGLESYVLNLAEALIAEHGWRIVVVTSGVFRGRVTWNLKVSPGVYRFRSDRHRSLRGSFSVTASG